MKKKILCLLFTTAFLTVSFAGCGKKEVVFKQESVRVELGSNADIEITDLVDFTERELKKTTLDLSEIDTMTVGEYNGYLVYDEDQRFPFSVVVSDTTPPDVTVAETIVVMAYEPNYIQSIVQSVTELSGNVTIEVRDNTYVGEGVEETTFEIGGVTCNNPAFVYSNIGEYDNELIISDEAGNGVACPFRVKVCTIPVFGGIENMTVKKGTDIDYMEGITASDCFGNDITASVTCDSSGVDTSVPGSYWAAYYVTDANGIQAMAPIEVTVEEVKRSSSGTSNNSYSNASYDEYLRSIYGYPDNEVITYYLDINEQEAVDRFYLSEFDFPSSDNGNSNMDLDGIQ